MQNEYENSLKEMSKRSDAAKLYITPAQLRRVHDANSPPHIKKKKIRQSSNLAPTLLMLGRSAVPKKDWIAASTGAIIALDADFLVEEFFWGR